MGEMFVDDIVIRCTTLAGMVHMLTNLLTGLRVRLARVPSSDDVFVLWAGSGEEVEI